MPYTTLAAFLAIVAFASYLQTICGFALGIIVVGLVALAGLLPLTSTVIIVSILSLTNVTLVLFRGHRQTHWGVVGAATIGLIPAIVVGVTLLNALSATAVQELNLLLGAFILVGAFVLMLRPEPLAAPSTHSATFAIGLIAGFFSGLFSAGGPALVYHLYRQPFPLPEIRATLLTLVGVATSLRLGYVGLQGDITLDIVVISALSAPVVFAGTMLGKRFVPPLTDRNRRRVAFGLLLLLGVTLVLSHAPV